MCCNLHRISEGDEINKDFELPAVRCLRDCLSFDDLASGNELHPHFNRS